MKVKKEDLKDPRANNWITRHRTWAPTPPRQYSWASHPGFSAKHCPVLTHRPVQKHLNLLTGQKSENNVILTSKINENTSGHNCGSVQWRSQSLSLGCTRVPKESFAQEKAILAKHVMRNRIGVRKERLLGNREERLHNRSSSDCVSKKKYALALKSYRSESLI